MHSGGERGEPGPVSHTPPGFARYSSTLITVYGTVGIMITYTPPTDTAAKPGGLATFTLAELAPFTREGTYATDASPDFHLFFTGRDDVHGILKYLWARVAVSAYMNMFGYDDEELNQLVMAVARDPLTTAVYTLDKSQAGGVHERAILASDMAADPQAYSAHFAVGQSATHQITHTKGGVLDGRVLFEGSVNWSASGEGTFVAGRQSAGGPGYKAQNNTLMVATDPDTCARFTAELVAEHLVAVAQGGKLSTAQPS
jgi:hypothetical protein